MLNPEMGKRPTAGIILAAGMSVRFGSSKHLIKVGKSTILSMVIDAALKSKLDHIVLVLGYNSDQIITTLGYHLQDPRLRMLINDRYRDGMSSSIQCGLAEIRDDFPSVMIILGDYPLLDAETINVLLDRFASSDKDICIPVYKGTSGLPVCFTRRFYADIMDISGDIGAKGIILKNPEHVLKVEINNPDCFFDVDNVKDMSELLSRFKNR